MHVVADSWWQPKRGHAPEEYEDAFCPVHADLTTAQFRCAVADGATEASFSRQWARTLTRAYWHGALRADHFAADVERLQSRWRAVFAARRQTQLPWYAQLLFEGASVLTPFMRKVAGEMGFQVSEKTRGFVLNADLPLVIQALEIGTRPSNLR